ncbi:MAG TPA: MoaD/ThiS family protein [Pirellulales bacterium]|jgi:molybdopterin synthase catalytic subunit/molybdopterin synthase sulfur carrier subunit
MTVRVKLFAVARELTGRDVLEITVPAGATVGGLRAALVVAAPELEKVARHVMFAIGTEYADDAQPLVEGVEVACIPPVSGG